MKRMGNKMLMASAIDRNRYQNTDPMAYHRNIPSRMVMDDPYYRDMPEMRRQRDSRGRYMTGYDDVYDTMPMIGFDREYERRMSAGNRAYDGDIYAKGSIMMSPNRDTPQMYRPVDEMTATKWVRGMKSEQGDGAKWKVEQTEQLRTSICPECDKWEFYVAMNMMKCDYGDVASRMGVDVPEFYARMAKSFLCDEDAGKNKLQKYMANIPK